jgi:pyruvate/2-oxoglutarate dehydrogenase complex dihydrolipoamide acyltransferase (E2) component
MGKQERRSLVALPVKQGTKGSSSQYAQQPQVAIVGVSRAAMKPVWDGTVFAPRLLLPLSLPYDHRVVDGADGARFTRLLSELLGDIRRMLL